MLISRCNWSGKSILAFLVCAAVWALNAHAAPSTDGPSITDRYREAIASPIRTDEDRDADARRKPLEFLQFTDVRPGMRVLDVAAGGGYTTQLLALAVGSGGTVWAQVSKMGNRLEQRFVTHPQPNIVALIRPFEDPVPSGVSGLDLVTIIMNYHDIAYMPVDRAKMNQRLFNALKPGGHLVVMDHSAKPGTGASAAKTLHRIDEAVVKNELQQAGFRLEQESDFLRNPADPREQAFFDTKIETDKFALRFVRP